MTRKATLAVLLLWSLSLSMLSETTAKPAAPASRWTLPNEMVSDARFRLTLRLLRQRRYCTAHRSLAWMMRAWPRGVLPGDVLLVSKRFKDAFIAYRPLVPVTQLDAKEHNDALDHVLQLAIDGDYRDASAAATAVPQPDDLTYLVAGAVYYAQGRTSDARTAWIDAVGRRTVPGGSSPYVGASVSSLYALDRVILAPSCTGRSDKKIARRVRLQRA
jgi:hypothetical protein